MTKRKRMNILSMAKLQATLFGLLGLLAGIIYSVGGFFYDLFTIGLNAGTALAFLALAGMPLIAAVCGFALGLVEAILFNLSAGWFGGIETDL